MSGWRIMWQEDYRFHSHFCDDLQHFSSVHDEWFIPTFVISLLQLSSTSTLLADRHNVYLYPLCLVLFLLYVYHTIWQVLHVLSSREWNPLKEVTLHYKVGTKWKGLKQTWFSFWPLIWTVHFQSFQFFFSCIHNQCHRWKWYVTEITYKFDSYFLFSRKENAKWRPNGKWILQFPVLCISEREDVLSWGSNMYIACILDIPMRVHLYLKM